MGRSNRPPGNTGGPGRSLYWQDTGQEPFDIPFGEIDLGEGMIEESLESRFRSARINIYGQTRPGERLLASLHDKPWRASIEFPFVGAGDQAPDFSEMGDMVHVSVEGDSREEVVLSVRALERAIAETPEGFPASEPARVVGFQESTSPDEERAELQSLAEHLEESSLPHADRLRSYLLERLEGDLEGQEREIYISAQGEVPGAGTVDIMVTSDDPERAFSHLERLFPNSLRLSAPE